MIAEKKPDPAQGEKNGLSVPSDRDKPYKGSSAPPAGITLTDEFVAALEALNAGRHVFLTGKAGTGKSTLIRHFMANTERKVIVAAPTGIAALNVGGHTLHRLFSFPPGADAAHVRGSSYRPGRFAKVLKTLDTLIVDEVSMVRADLFDAVAAALELYGPKPGEPFGGVQVVLVGDLYQLPPVVQEREKKFFATQYGSEYFFSAEAYNSEHFVAVGLTRVFRQQGDAQLTDILNAIREGTIDEDARAILNTRHDPEFTSPPDEFWLTLATTNRIAGARNKQALARLSGDEITSVGTFTGDTKGFEAPTDERLTYKVGAQIMLLVNHSSGQFVNGSLGTIEESGVDDGQPWVRVRLQDDSHVTVGPHTWEITQPVVHGGRLIQEVAGTFTQLPFRLAWAITIHKSQGQTVDRLIVDLSGGTFAYGQLYVALSRCTSMQGLVLKRPVATKDLKTDQRVRRFLNASTSKVDAPHVYLGMCWAGNEGRLARPRPVEIAIVRDDGTEMTTLVNPESDLYDSRADYGIGAADVICAPRLREAWPALQTVMAGHVPVGVHIDESLGWIDFELKRNGVVMLIPLGTGLDTAKATPAIAAGLRAPTALERARAVRDLAALCDLSENAGEAFSYPIDGGYLLPRGVPVEHCTCFGDEDWVSVATSRHPVVSSADDDLGTLLVTGTRVCFTGSVIDDSGRSVDRAEIEDVAIRLGLKPVGNVSKTRCDVLVVAELGTQSGKARKAAEFGKPVIEASAFLRYAEK